MTVINCFLTILLEEQKNLRRIYHHLVVFRQASWLLLELLVFWEYSLVLELCCSPSGRTGPSLMLFTSVSSPPPPSGLGTWPRILQEKVIRFLLIYFYDYEHPGAINKNLSQSLCRLQCMISLFILFYMHGTLCHWIITNTLRSKITVNNYPIL